MFGFALVLTRISSFLLVLPVFGSKGIPTVLKVAVAVFLSIFFCTTAPLGIDPAGIGTLGAILLLAGEAVYGLALGLSIALLFSVVQFSGHVVEQQMGLTMAEIVNPLTEEEAGPLANLLEMIFLLLFLSANGHHLFLLVLAKSYSAFPAGTIPTLGALVSGVVETGSVMFLAGLRFKSLVCIEPFNQFGPIKSRCVELRPVDTSEFRFTVDGDTASAAHSRSVNHYRIQ